MNRIGPARILPLLACLLGCASGARATSMAVDMDAPARAGQCLLDDASRLSVLSYESDRGAYYVGLRKPDGAGEVVLVQDVAPGRRDIIPLGERELSAPMAGLVVDALLARGLTPIPRGGHEAFRARTGIERCPWPSLDALRTAASL